MSNATTPNQYIHDPQSSDHVGKRSADARTHADHPQTQGGRLLVNYDLSALNTMALNCVASQAVILTHEHQVPMACMTHLPLFVLSGGSNVLLPEQLDARVLMPHFTGINIVHDADDHVIIDVMGGEVWHELVLHTVNQGWYGIENLALIPGLVGAAPVQNIGAYGAQLADVLVGVKVYDLHAKRWEYITHADCAFDYRTSRFKNNSQKLITCLRLNLHKDPTRINTDYGDLSTTASDLAHTRGLSAPTPKEVMDAVIQIRNSKLPDPSVLANCGSFFQNPIIGREQCSALLARYPTMPYHDIDTHSVKVPAGWLIERVGLKGGGVAPILTHKQQALVLTNHAPHIATQRNIKISQDFIIKSVAQEFGIFLVREPVWVMGNGTLSFL